ncbi:MAG: hypothetical protein WCK89_19575, partial [bacterium]
MINGCRSGGRVAGRSNVGGIVGYTVQDLKFCVNSGTVSGADWVGGVVGFGDSPVIGCSNSGAVSGSNTVGGVAGECPLPMSCDNSGPVAGVAGGARIGGVVGYSWWWVDTCRNSGSVTGPVSVGGLVGACEGAVNVGVNSGSVSGDSSVGGVVGSLSSLPGYPAAMLNSANCGAVRGTNSVGGLVGDSQGGTWNCANTGTVSGVTAVGGVAGYLGSIGTVSNCANAGVLSGLNGVGAMAGTNDGACVNSYWKQTGVAPFNLAVTGGGTGTVTDCQSFSAAPGTLTSPVTVGGVTTNGLSAVLNAWAAANWTWEAPFRRWTAGTAGAYPLPMTACWTDTGNYDTNWYSEAGSQFTLGTAAQLAGIAALVNAGHSFSNKTVTLSADISLSGFLWVSIGQGSSSGPESYSAFSGTFDGNGKTVSGAYAGGGLYSEDFLMASVFGVVGEGAMIRNLRVADADLTGMMASGLVNMNDGGTVQNCSTGGRLRGYYGAGGLAWINQGAIMNCFSSLAIDPSPEASA